MKNILWDGKYIFSELFGILVTEYAGIDATVLDKKRSAGDLCDF